MKPFTFVAADSVSRATELLSDADGCSFAISGGTDLMGEIKEGVVSPSRLISLAGLSAMKGIEEDGAGVRVGALTTVAEVQSHPTVIRDYAALAQAAASVATPQIRNVGTVGGNLCQRPRCWYYRSPLFDCRKKGGAICFAAEGSNKYHAILGGVDCHIVHPSDLAVALTALGARVTIAGVSGARTIQISEFFVGPERDVTVETVLKQGEIVTQVTLPAANPGRRSVYLKAKERKAFDFALASAAVSIDVEDGVVRAASVVLGGVAPVPYRATQADAALTGAGVDAIDVRAVGELAVADARPLRDNHYKVGLAASLVSRALSATLHPPEGLPDSAPFPS